MSVLIITATLHTQLINTNSHTNIFELVFIRSKTNIAYLQQLYQITIFPGFLQYNLSLSLHQDREPNRSCLLTTR